MSTEGKRPARVGRVVALPDAGAVAGPVVAAFNNVPKDDAAAQALALGLMNACRADVAAIACAACEASAAKPATFDGFAAEAEAAFVKIEARYRRLVTDLEALAAKSRATTPPEPNTQSHPSGGPP